jgi:hypothetical protein
VVREGVAARGTFVAFLCGFGVDCTQQCRFPDVSGRAVCGWPLKYSTCRCVLCVPEGRVHPRQQLQIQPQLNIHSKTFHLAFEVDN